MVLIRGAAVRCVMAPGPYVNSAAPPSFVVATGVVNSPARMED